MVDISYKTLDRALPFFGLSSNQIINLLKVTKEDILQLLENNDFSRNMLQHVNGFSKDNYTCGYYQENSLLNLQHKHLTDCFKSFHLNLVSFSKNGNSLAAYLKSLSCIFDIICITETRKTNIGIIEKEFPDHHIFIDNPTTAKGGVALLLRKNKFDNITELDPIKLSCNCSKCQIENKWLSFKVQNQDFIIGGIYRHPGGDLEHFNSALNGHIKKTKNGTLAMTLGDININLLNLDNAHTSTYLNIYLENNFIPCITIPTRINHTSQTLIDHIFIKIPPKLIQNKCSSGNLITDISDHLPNFLFFDLKIPTVKNRPFVRLFTENNKKLFADKLSEEAPLINDNELTDSNRAYDIFSNNYLNLFNKYFPFTRMSKKCFKNKPHITSGIKVSIRFRNRLFKKYLKIKIKQTVPHRQNLKTLQPKLLELLRNCTTKT